MRLVGEADHLSPPHAGCGARESARPDQDLVRIARPAHYMLCRVSTTGEKGPWSETASATIGA